DEVARLADHLVLIEAGKVLTSGPILETLARMYLPLAIGGDAGVVIEGTVTAYDSQYQLVTVTLPGSSLRMRVELAV
ncbi:molybdenum ABC transporter ATP-binding protein, partial [Pseudomonas syringae pv. tagetis]